MVQFKFSHLSNLPISGFFAVFYVIFHCFFCNLGKLENTHPLHSQSVVG